MTHKPPTIDADFVRYPRTLGGKPAPPPVDMEAAAKAASDDYIRGDWREKMVNDAILKDFYEKEAHAFMFGNRK